MEKDRNQWIENATNILIQKKQRRILNEGNAETK
jgi:hypothetical protein